MTRTFSIFATVNLFLTLLLVGANCAYYYLNEARFAEQQMITWNLLMDHELDLAQRVSDLYDRLDYDRGTSEARRGARIESQRAREYNRLAGRQINEFKFREALVSISLARAATISAENQLRCGNWTCPAR